MTDSVQQTAASGDAGDETFLQMVARVIKENDPDEATDILCDTDPADLATILNEDFMKLARLAFEDDADAADKAFGNVVARLTGEDLDWFLGRAANLEDQDEFNSLFNDDKSKEHRNRLFEGYLARNDVDNDDFRLFLENCGKTMTAEQRLRVADKIAGV